MGAVSNYKGYNTVLKGIVVDDKDPENLNRVQVRIPSYHGDQDFPNEDGTSGLPWAQMCSVTTKSGGIMGLLSGGSSSVIPEVGDIVWLLFEGGDIRTPVVIGTIPKEILPVNDGTNYYTVGGTLADIATQIIMAQEGTYDSINPNDNGAISIGKIQWHAGRALTLLKEIQKKNEEQFKQYAGTSGLITAMTGNWSTFTVVSGTAIYNAIKNILNSTEGHEAQDEIVKKDVSKYIEHGKKLGITDPEALIYFADYENQNGSGGAESMLKKCSKPYTVDNIHKIAQGNFTTRRNKVYSACIQAKNDGKLNSIDGDLSSIPVDLKPGQRLAYPVPSCRTLSAGYPRYPSGGRHDGIDIACVSGSKVIAPMDGTVVIRKELNRSYGYHVAIENGNLKVYTCHMSYINPGIQVGVKVKMGDVLGLSGNTGNSTGPHCHFEVRVNNVATNPGPYLGINASGAGKV